MSAVSGGDKLDFVGQHSTWRRVLSPTGNTGDAVFRVLMFAVALLMVGIVIAKLVALSADSMLSIRRFGFGFLISQRWDPVADLSKIQNQIVESTALNRRSRRPASQSRSRPLAAQPQTSTREKRRRLYFP